MACSCRRPDKMDPGPRRAIHSLERLDLVTALQCECDLVEPLQETFATPRINLEGVGLSRRRNDRPRLKVDADTSCALSGFDLRCKCVDDLLVDHDREDPVLKTIGKEDIAKTRADDGADT